PPNISIAQAFADQFGVPVEAAGAGVGFRRNGKPGIRGFRIVWGKLQNVFYIDGGGGWGYVAPTVGGL
ncbi:MAG: hypothetical protein AB1813_19930, partial [Verrucomicrobiota bacterium]